jgi:MFS family permease
MTINALWNKHAKSGYNGRHVGSKSNSKRYLNMSLTIQQTTTSASPPKPETWPYLMQLSVNYLGWAFCWTTATSYMVPNALLTMVDDSVKNARLGLITSLSNLFVIILIPLFGALSDGATSRFGRRRPFFLTAALIMSILLLLVTRCHAYILLLSLVVLMHGALALWFPNRALIRDLVPLERRGRISGLSNLTNTLGIMLAHAVASRLIGTRMFLLALIAITANILANLWVALRIREKPSERESSRSLPSWREVYLPRLEKTRGLGWLAACNILTYMGVVAMTCFLLYFVKDQIDRENFNVTFGKTVLIAMGAGIPSSLAAGFLADRFGRRRVFLVACLLQLACMVNFLLAPRGYATLYLSGLLFGLGNGAYLSMYWTLVSDMIPAEEASKYIGLMQYTMLIPWVVTPLTLGPIVDGFGAASGTGYNILFSIIVVFLLAGLFLIRKIPETLHRSS